MRVAIRRKWQLDVLNIEDVVEGYWWGRNGDVEPGPNCSYSHWHGWRNGMADSGRIPVDQAQREFAHDFVKVGIAPNPAASTNDYGSGLKTTPKPVHDGEKPK